MFGLFQRRNSLLPVLLFLTVWSSLVTVVTSLYEGDRLREYDARNYTWPIRDYKPNTEGWKQLMEERFAQIDEIPSSGGRYEGYLQTIGPAMLVDNFTEYGFGLGRAPESLTKELQMAIQEGLESGKYHLEPKVEVIEGPRSIFISRPDLMRKVLHEMEPYAEAWSGVDVTPFRAYGFRLYQNQSSLHMHIDKPETHVLSFIYHIDSSDDAEPWPIFIEDFHGNTHEVILTPGDLLFYESSKCFHGRPRKFNGSWYNSIFVHYYPVHWRDAGYNHDLERHYAVPQRWKNPPPSARTHEQLAMVGTAMKEPHCPDEWCRTKNTIKWTGPGEEGHWIKPNFEKLPLNLQNPLGLDEL